MIDDRHAVIDGNIEALNQGSAILKQLTDEQYIFIPKPFVESSIGQHVRHIVDIFQALIHGLEPGQIDYDVRSRGSEIETHRSVGLSTLQSIKTWFIQIKNTPAYIQANPDVQILTEVQLSQQRVVALESNFIRECIFTCSHAVHHYALIKVIGKLQNIVFDANIGVAPATASYLRENTRLSEEVFSSLTFAQQHIVPDTQTI